MTDGMTEQMMARPEMGEPKMREQMGGADHDASTKVITQNELGGPEVLKVEYRPKPDPGLSEIRIRVHAAAVNPIDGVNRETGMFIGAPPFVLGWDISGTVDAVGLGVTLYQPGDEVFGMLPFPHVHGSYAEYAVGPTRAFVRKPSGVDHITAAALPMVGLTAWQALVDTANIGQGSRVMINGAAGGIGHIAIQIAKARGAYVVGLASAANHEFVRSLGADEVIDYRTVDFAHVVTGLDSVLDVVGEDYPDRALTVLKPGGVFVTTQPTALRPETIEAATEQGVRVAGILVEADGCGLAALAQLVSMGKVTPTIAANYPLEEAGTAQTTKPAHGKVVLTMD